MRLIVPIVAIGLVAACLATAPPVVAQPASSTAEPPKADWIEAIRNGCKIWNAAPEGRQEVTWFGACVKGLAEGPGRLQWYQEGQRTDLYEGDMRAGLMDGKGTYNWRNGDRYIGDFRANKRGGEGVLVFYNGDRYEGEFRDNQQQGHGIYVWRDGDRYEGDFVAGHFQGKGVFKFKSGATFDGEWKNDLPNGQGSHRAADGKMTDGVWTNGCLKDGARREAVLVTRKRCGF